MARNVALWLPERKYAQRRPIEGGRMHSCGSTRGTRAWGGRAAASAAMGEDAPEGDDEGADGEDFDTSQMPPYDFRINTVKLLLEVGQLETALRVIDTLVRDGARTGPAGALWAARPHRRIRCGLGTRERPDGGRRRGRAGLVPVRMGVRPDGRPRGGPRAARDGAAGRRRSRKAFVERAGTLNKDWTARRRLDWP